MFCVLFFLKTGFRSYLVGLRNHDVAQDDLKLRALLLATQELGLYTSSIMPTFTLTLIPEQSS